MTEILVALVTLTFLEIVLGVDNVIFIAILSGKLPDHDRIGVILSGGNVDGSTMASILAAGAPASRVAHA